MIIDVSKLTTDEKIGMILTDLAYMKSDISWLKKISTVTVIAIGAFVGVDLTSVA